MKMTLAKSVFVVQTVATLQLEIEKVGHCQVGYLALLFSVSTFENSVEFATLNFSVT